MPAITITDLNNAKLDVDHIDDVANSEEHTATNRHGVEKETVAGALYKIGGIVDRGAWTALTVYASKDIVLTGGTWYICVVAHTSSALFATDSASKWRVYQGVMSADLAATSAGKGAEMVGFDPAAGAAENFWPETSPPTQIRQAIDYLVNKVGAYEYNLLDPKWGIIQKLTTTPAQSVRAEIQAVLDYAANRRNVLADTVNKARVYAPGASYWLDSPLYLPTWIEFVADIANYEFFGACLRGMSGFNGGAGGDLVRLQGSPDPTNGTAYWGGTFVGFNMRGAPDGSVQYGFNTKNEAGDNVALQDTAVIDYLSGRYLASGFIRVWGGVPNYIHRLRPYACNGPGVTLVGNTARHTITHIQEISGDQCNGGLIRYVNMSDSDVLVITALKSESTHVTHAFNHGTTDEFYPLCAAWKDAGHDAQHNAIFFENATGGRVVINGAHHISAQNAKQIVTYIGDTFTTPTIHDLADNNPIRFALVASGSLPSGLTAATDYYVKVTGPKTFKIASSVPNVAAGPYISPTGGSGAIYGDPGFVTPGDMIGFDAQVPSIEINGAYIRYRPWASGGVERLGTKPNIISHVPTGDNTGAAPRYKSIPLECPFSVIVREAPSVMIGTGASSSTRQSRFLVGTADYPASLLSEDTTIGAAGNMPAFMLWDEDAASGGQVALLRSNGGGVLLTALNEATGTSTDWIRFGRAGDGTASTIAVYKTLDLDDGANIILDTAVGTKLGTGTNQKLGFWNATPVVRPASAAQAAVTGSAAASYDATTQATINELKALVNQLRADLVTMGLIKGGA